MRSCQTRIALAVLRRFVAESEALAGDLLEELTVRRSHMWLWRQVVTAVLLEALRPATDEIRPLRLIEEDRYIPPVGPPRATRTPINLSASPTAGAGGLGIVALAALVTAVEPRIWWAGVLAVAAGVMTGALLIHTRARQIRSRAGSDTPAVLLPRG